MSEGAKVVEGDSWRDADAVSVDSSVAVREWLSDRSETDVVALRSLLSVAEGTRRGDVVGDSVIEGSVSVAVGVNVSPETDSDGDGVFSSLGDCVSVPFDSEPLRVGVISSLDDAL